MEWSKEYSTGIESIDDQHQELFRRGNNLVKAIRERRCREEIDKIITFLDDYARVHFSDEEDRMKEAGYPGLEEQVRLHREFLASLADLKNEASLPRVPGSSYDLSAATNQVVVDWIINHILKVDIRFGDFLRAEGKLL